MATRQEIHLRRAELKRTLRERCRTGELRSGTLAPSKRQLAEEFSVSATIVGQVMQELIEENLFHTLPRSGTYVGPRRPLMRERYILICDVEPDSFSTALRTGFEDRVAALGGAVIALSRAQVRACVRTQSLPPAAGVLEWAHRLSHDEWTKLLEKAPATACYATLESEADERDSVAFDDVDGGRQATEHLLHLGHRNIAFLGLHRQNARSGPAWSRLRESGWRQALHEAGLNDNGLAFYAARAVPTISHPDQVEVAREAARRLLRRTDVDAVVVANDRAAQALVEELRAEMAPKSWPSIVSFDNDPQVQSEAITSMRLPWEEIGKTAAELLWERAHDKLPREPQHRLVKMRLIPRLTCQPNWGRTGFDASLVNQLLTPSPGVLQ
jgi:DNA-binding LacI/PurR family transcriptional regulator